MNRSEPEKMTVDQLVQRFAEVGVEQERAIFKEEICKFKEIFGEMTAIDTELKKRGYDARRALIRLYAHPSIQVQLQAARCSLAVNPIAARQLIETISRSGRMPQAGDAGMTLSNLDDGFFRPT